MAPYFNMTFLEAVNRILRLEGVIQGDDDDLTSFSDTQHAATSSLAQIAVQAQIADLMSDAIIPYERKSATITTSASTRTYSLASDFQNIEERFMDEEDGSGNVQGTRLIHYLGGEAQLRRNDMKYRETSGTPINFYFPGGTSKTVAMYPVPTAAIVYRYYYEADVSVSVTTDTIPFVTTTEAETFVRMAARHFKYLKASPQVREGLFPQGVEKDQVILAAKASLIGLLNPLPRHRRYGKRYGRA